MAAQQAAGERGAIQVPMAGLTLLSIILFIAVSAILMGRAAETWDSQVRHELEETLIARGEEYKRGIEEYLRDNGRLPMKLEDLCPKEKADRRYIRRCWKDPITGEDFRLISPGEAGRRKLMNEAKREQEGEDDPLLGGFGRHRDAKKSGSGDDGEGKGADDGSGDAARDASRAREGPALSDVKFVMPGQESRQQLEGEKPILGVASDSDREGFRSYQGSSVYSEWEFVANWNPAAARRPGVPGAPGFPGAPGVPPPGARPTPPGAPTPFGTPRFPTPLGGGRFPTPPRPGGG